MYRAAAAARAGAAAIRQRQVADLDLQTGEAERTVLVVTVHDDDRATPVDDHIFGDFRQVSGEGDFPSGRVGENGRIEGDQIRTRIVELPIRHVDRAAQTTIVGIGAAYCNVRVV